MAAFDTLRTTLNAAIRQNGNNEITGTVLNTILNTVITELGRGMRYMGIANLSTVASTDQIPKFYISFTPGSYTTIFPGIAQTRYSAGMAIFADADGTNSWSMTIWNPSDTATINTSRFVMDAIITGSQYSNDAIIYVASASRGASSNTIEIHKQESGVDTGVIATITDTNVPTGFATYTTTLADNGGTLNLSVDWSVVPAGTTKTFTGLTEAIDKSARARLTTSSVDSIFFINVSYVGSSYVADKTFTEINTAFNNGKQLVVVYSGFYFVHAQGSSSGHTFNQFTNQNELHFSVTNSNVWTFSTTVLALNSDLTNKAGYTKRSSSSVESELELNNLHPTKYGVMRASVTKADTAFKIKIDTQYANYEGKSYIIEIQGADSSSVRRATDISLEAGNFVHHNITFPVSITDSEVAVFKYDGTSGILTHVMTYIGDIQS